MNRIFLSIGSNIEPSKNIPACLDLLKKELNVLKISPVYETAPVGPAGPDKFWNLAAEVESLSGKDALIEKLREIEAALGRVRDPGNKFAARPIDIDVLPQPDYQHHAFIMIPLADIAPETKDPVTGKSFKELAEKLRKKNEEFLKKIEI